MALERCLPWCGGRRDDNGIHHFEGRQLRSIPRVLSARPLAVKEAWLQDNRITDLAALAGCGNMELLYCPDNDLAAIDTSAARSWVSLQEVNISANPRLAAIPITASNWQSLKQLYANDLPLLTQLPATAMAAWANLKVLHLNQSGIAGRLPGEVGSLVSLTQVSVCGNPQLSGLPASVGSWVRLEKAFLNDNPLLTSLPEEVGALVALEKLYVNGCGLTRLPNSLGQLGSLEELYAAHNRLKALPASLAALPRLNKLHAPGNRLVCVPRLPPSLELLNLDANAIEAVDPEVPSGVRVLLLLGHRAGPFARRAASYSCSGEGRHRGGRRGHFNSRARPALRRLPAPSRALFPGVGGSAAAHVPAPGPEPARGLPLRRPARVGLPPRRSARAGPARQPRCGARLLAGGHAGSGRARQAVGLWRRRRRSEERRIGGNPASGR